MNITKYEAVGIVISVLGGLYFLDLSRWKIPSRAAPYLQKIKEVEKLNNLPKNLLVRLIQQESSFNPNAHNKGSGAQGLCQIVPRWHPTVKNPFDPDECIPYAGAYLRKLYNHYGYWDLTLAAYNWGRGNVSKLIDSHGKSGFNKMPLETKNYVTDILGDI